MHRLLTVIAVLAATLLAAAARAQTVIELRPSATLPLPAAAVRLDQVADLTGPDADKLASVVVFSPDAAATAATLARDAVKNAINNGRPSTNWARTLLRGGDIQITFAHPSPAAANQITSAPPSSTPSPSQLPQPAPLPPPPLSSHTLRALILDALADTAGVTHDAVMLRIDALPPADQQLLTQPVPAAWKCRVQVLGATPNGRTPVRIEAFESDRVPLNRTFNVDAMVTREVLVVATPGGLTRDQVVASADVRYDTRTIAVNESARLAAISPDAVIGSVAKRRIDQGKPILPADVAAPKAAVVAKRGDEITVSCVCGGMVVKAKAKAMGAARDGELVTLQMEGSKKTFTARMNGPGKAVLALDAQ